MADGVLSSVYGLNGKVALVTGGGSGIGKAVASCLAQSGASLVIAGRREDVLAEAAAEIGHDCRSVVLDITDFGSIEAFEEAFAREHGPVDILVNNAGNTLKKPFEDSSLEDFDAVFDVHVRGALELSRKVIRRALQGERESSILFISSMTAYIGQPQVSGYTIAKTAINGVVRGLAAEFAARGVRVNAVAPGWIDTDLYRKATQGDTARQEKILGRIPMNRLGETDEIGWTCAFLASRAASYINGQVVLVDGGGATGF